MTFGFGSNVPIALKVALPPELLFSRKLIKGSNRPSLPVVAYTHSGIPID